MVRITSDGFFFGNNIPFLSFRQGLLRSAGRADSTALTSVLSRSVRPLPAKNGWA
jgi:hypothetical protein